MNHKMNGVTDITSPSLASLTCDIQLLEIVSPLFSLCSIDRQKEPTVNKRLCQTPHSELLIEVPNWPNRAPTGTLRPSTASGGLGDR